MVFLSEPSLHVTEVLAAKADAGRAKANINAVNRASDNSFFFN